MVFCREKPIFHRKGFFVFQFFIFQTMEKIIIPVSGMHCTSCEILLEKSIKKLPNIEKVKASEKK